MGKRARRRSREREAVTDAAVRALDGELQRVEALGTQVVTIEELERLVAARSIVAARIDDLVRELAFTGVGWVPIAVALGVSRQAARQRYGQRR